MNEAVRGRPGVDGTLIITGAWCQTCRQESMPTASGFCTFCDSRIVDEGSLSIHDVTKGDAMATATAVKCKVDGCGNDAAAAVGMYAKLCDDHKKEKQARAPVASSGSLVVAVRALAAPAKRLEKARAKLAGCDTNEAARAELAEAMRRVQGSATTDNLARLETATRALRDGAPRRDKAQAEVTAATRAFRAALDNIVREAA